MTEIMEVSRVEQNAIKNNVSDLLIFLAEKERETEKQTPLAQDQCISLLKMFERLDSLSPPCAGGDGDLFGSAHEACVAIRRARLKKGIYHNYKSGGVHVARDAFLVLAEAILLLLLRCVEVGMITYSEREVETLADVETMVYLLSSSSVERVLAIRKLFIKGGLAEPQLALERVRVYLNPENHPHLSS